MSTSRSELTRRKLIDAARTEFAEHGIAGARVDRIAELSGVNKQRIYPNFGSKEGMFAAVISDTYKDLAEQVPIPETIEAMREYVGVVFDYHARSSDLARLIAWEGLHYGANDFPGQEEREAYYLGKGRKLAGVLGIDDPREAAHLLLSLIAVASWPFVAEQQRRLMAGSESCTPEGRARLRESLVGYGRTLVDAVCADGARGAAGAEGAARN
ncbi:TetR/AcrR family transcriptional regulator [Streptomyces sp. NPDC053048]|uniref:TetR/AcrR family transcriptional regulator n=1 Tax=Streptomyces sp. NPDC053048 TaxID=3365694 RepID=UPI0037D173C7